MKKLIAFIAASILCFNLYATNITSSTAKHLLDGDEVIVSPDTIHLFFHGCSPHGEFVYITNNTSEGMAINRIYSDVFNVECLINGEDVSDSGLLLSAEETVEIQVFVSILGKNELDSHGYLFIDTDYGIYTITIFHENYLSIETHQTDFKVYPNPADDRLTLNAPSLGKITIFNVLGQLMDEFVATHDEIVIPTTLYPNGIYFVRTDLGGTKRVIVNH